MLLLLVLLPLLLLPLPPLPNWQLLLLLLLLPFALLLLLPLRLLLFPPPRIFRRHAAFQSLPWPLRLVGDGQLLSLTEGRFEKLTPHSGWESNPGRRTNYRMQIAQPTLAVSHLLNTDQH